MYNARRCLLSCPGASILCHKGIFRYCDKPDLRQQTEADTVSDEAGTVSGHMLLFLPLGPDTGVKRHAVVCYPLHSLRGQAKLPHTSSIANLKLIPYEASELVQEKPRTSSW